MPFIFKHAKDQSDMRTSRMRLSGLPSEDNLLTFRYHPMIIGMTRRFGHEG